MNQSKFLCLLIVYSLIICQPFTAAYADEEKQSPKVQTQSQGWMSEISNFINRYIPGGYAITNTSKKAVSMAKAIRYKESGKSANTTLEYLRPHIDHSPQQLLVPSDIIPITWDRAEIGLPLKFEFQLIAEGVWYPVDLSVQDEDKTLVWYARVRPRDNSGIKLPQTYVELYAYDLTKVNLGYCSGLDNVYQDDDFSHRPVLSKGTSIIPESISSSTLLVSAFRGGYRFEDGLTPKKETFGVINNTLVHVPLTPNLVGLGVTESGLVVMEAYDPFKRYLEFRQNALPLILNGKMTEAAAQGKIWFHDTHGNDALYDSLPYQAAAMDVSGRWLIIARSGRTTLRGITVAMGMAHADRAIILDQNARALVTHALYKTDQRTQTRNVYYGSDYDLEKTFDTRAQNLRFIDRQEQRDFFYIYRKPPLQEN